MDPHRSTAGRRLGPLLLWLLRACWVVQPVAIRAYGDALDGRSAAVQWTAAIGLWAGWGLVIVALLVPATSTLTIARMAVPAALVTSVWASLAGGGGVAGASVIALAAVCTLLVASGDVGQVFVQASAYGAEQRLLLRPPPPWLVLVVVTWAVTVAGVLAGPLLVAAGRWWLGVPVTIAGALLAWQGGLRAHRLSRRWLVFVPAGVVVHDQVVLAEPYLFRTIDVARIGVAMADTGAADFTGGALGPAIEIALRDLTTMVSAPTPSTPQGKAFHVRAMLVSPTRPGRALEVAATNRLPT